MFIKATTPAQVVNILNANNPNSDYQHETNRHGDAIIIEYPEDGGESIEWSIEEQQEGFYLHC